MHAIVGHLETLLGLAPGLPLHGLLWALGKTRRPHELVGVFRALLQMLATVSSPVKIGLTFALLLLAFTAESSRAPRETEPLLASVVGLLTSVHLALCSPALNAHSAAVWPPAAATLLSLAFASRLWARLAA